MQHYAALTREQIREAFGFAMPAPWAASLPTAPQTAPRVPALDEMGEPARGYMLHAGVPLLLDAGVYLPGLMPPGTGDAQRVALEAYSRPVGAKCCSGAATKR